MDATVIPLDMPWSLYDDVEQVAAGEKVIFSASGMPALAIVDGFTLRYGRGRQQPFTEGMSLQWGPRQLRIWNLPVSSTPAYDAIDLRLHDGKAGHIDLELAMTGCLGRWSKERVSDPLGERALEREIMLAIMIDQIEEIANLERADIAAQGFMRGRLRADWRCAAEILLNARDVNEPRMALIVRHASSLHRHISELGRHPRRVLSRNRRLQAVHRIQELDSTCLAWYVRQPGRTPAEKAGSRRSLLAIVREETVDTPENQVLRDFLTRTVQAAESYLGANRNLATSSRYSEVSRYHQTCTALLRRPEFSEIRSLHGVAKPNYVLTSDPRYRCIWDAYQQLLRRQDAQDDAWSWQARLWGDMVALVVNTAFLFDTTIEVLALPPLYLRKDHDRGRWLESTGCNGIFATSTLVLTVHDTGADSASSEIVKRYRILGPRLVVRKQALGQVQQNEDVLVWAVVSAGSETSTLDNLTERADAALARWRDERRRFYNEQCRVRGIVVALSDRLSGALQIAEHGNTVGFMMPLDGSGFYSGIESIGTQLICGTFQ